MENADLIRALSYALIGGGLFLLAAMVWLYRSNSLSDFEEEPVTIDMANLSSENQGSPETASSPAEQAGVHDARTLVSDGLAANSSQDQIHEAKTLLSDGGGGNFDAGAGSDIHEAKTLLCDGGGGNMPPGPGQSDIHEAKTLLCDGGGGNMPQPPASGDVHEAKTLLFEGGNFNEQAMAQTAKEPEDVHEAKTLLFDGGGGNMTPPQTDDVHEAKTLLFEGGSWDSGSSAAAPAPASEASYDGKTILDFGSSGDSDHFGSFQETASDSVSSMASSGQQASAPAGGPMLVGIRGSIAGKCFPLQESGATVGSSDACSIKVSTVGLAPKHFKLSLSQGSWRVLDLTGDGISVNGSTVASHVLVKGDTLEVGSGRFEFRC